MNYEYKSKPFSHQEKLFNETADTKIFGVLWEQGTGKTKPIIDTAAHLFEKGEIDCLFVVAPGGVHINWVRDEIEAHMPDRIPIHTFYWRSGKSNTKYHQAEVEEVIKSKKLAVITISYDGFMTQRGKKFVWRVLRRRSCIYVLDEAHHIKAPGAKRAISVLASGKYADYRRILTGTPVAVGPFDIYSQLKFLDPNIWKRRGMGSFFAFKRHYGVWHTRADEIEETGFDPGYDQLVCYKNVEELEHIISDISSRVLADDVLDLPPKLYSRRYFEMSAKQASLYAQLKADYIAELETHTIEAPLAIVRLLRFAQVLSGYLPSEDGEATVPIPGPSPRMDLLKEVVEGLTHPAIIWCRFRKDIDMIMEFLGERAFRYDGAVSEDEAWENQERWKAGERDYLVANPAKGKEGLTWVRARTVIYYNNSYKLLDRLQSEARACRIGQEHPVNIIDLMCYGTVDEQVVRNLIKKFDIAAKITGDKLRDWL
jgi:SNF2 family DNA or RNA helicase